MTEQFSDAGSIGTVGGFVDANQAYPHPTSLDPPVRSPVAAIAPEYKEYDSHEKAERYVSSKISDLRFCKISLQFLQNAQTSGNSLTFPAIPAKFREILAEKSAI